jgi:hypothetical protein
MNGRYEQIKDRIFNPVVDPERTIGLGLLAIAYSIESLSKAIRKGNLINFVIEKKKMDLPTKRAEPDPDLQDKC